MGFWDSLDPSGNNFLGLGPKIGRIMAGINTAGGSEFHRTDPGATTPGSTWNKVGRGFGGAGPGAVGGFFAGGVPGAIVGGIGGGIAGGTGATNSTTMSGWGEDLGIGVGSGKLAALTYGGGGGSLFGGGGGGGGGVSAMTPYMPTSTPAMGQAGSTLGGGMDSALNLGPSAMDSTGAEGMAGGGAASSPSALSKALNYARMMPQGGGQQSPASSQVDLLDKLYRMFPGLKPGAQVGQSPNIGGMGYGS